MEKKYKYGQQVLVLLLLCLGLSLVGSFLMVLGQMAIGSTSTVGLLIMQAISQLFIFILPLIFLAMIYKINVKEWWLVDFSGSKWGKAGIGLVILLLLLPIIEYITVWNDGWHFGGKMGEFEQMFRNMTEQQSVLMEKFLSGDSIGRLLLNLVVIALVPAVCEELFFRGGLQQLLTKWFKNGHIAIWVTAAVFSLFHCDIFAFMPRFVLGVVLGYAFYYGGSIVVSSCMHFVNNALVVVLYYLYGQGVVAISPEEPMELPMMWVVLGAVAGIALLYTMFIMGNEKKKIE